MKQRSLTGKMSQLVLTLKEVDRETPSKVLEVGLRIGTIMDGCEAVRWNRR
jgi:hypothetical protein